SHTAPMHPELLARSLHDALPIWEDRIGRHPQLTALDLDALALERNVQLFEFQGDGLPASAPGRVAAASFLPGDITDAVSAEWAVNLTQPSWLFNTAPGSPPAAPCAPRRGRRGCRGGAARRRTRRAPGCRAAGRRNG